MVQDKDILALPSQKQWPVSLRPRKNQWPLALIKHITYNSSVAWPEYTKQKRAFGMPEDSTWYLFTIDSQVFDSVMIQSKRSSDWFFRYANAKIPWTLKSIELKSITSTACEVMSAHVIRDFLTKNDAKSVADESSYK